MIRRLILAGALLAAVLPAASADAYCQESNCTLECLEYVIAHFDIKDPQFVCLH